MAPKCPFRAYFYASSGSSQGHEWHLVIMPLESLPGRLGPSALLCPFDLGIFEEPGWSMLFTWGSWAHPHPPALLSCNSEVKYASEKHFRDKVFYAPVPTVTAYSETIVAAPNCTWRSYRSQLTLEPRPRALHFRSTTIIFPKHASSSFRTTLHLSLGRPRRWFTASVQLQLCQCPGPSLLGPAAL